MSSLDKKFLITAVKNPFDPFNSREVKVVDLVEGWTAMDCLTSSFPTVQEGLEVVVSCNGLVLDTDELLARPIQSRDSIAFCVVPAGGGGGGGGKNPLRIIATIVVIIIAIVAPYTAPAISAGWGAGTVGGTLLSAGVMAAGTLIVNAVLPLPDQDLPALQGWGGGDGQKASATYGWDVRLNPDAEGGVWPVIHGRMKTLPRIISKHVTVEGNSNYLNILLLLADHEIDEVSSVLINGIDSANYRDVESESRLGQIDQDVISYFQDTIEEQAVSQQLNKDTTTWTTSVSTTGALAEGLAVAITMPRGLYYANNSGGVSSTNVTYQIQYSIRTGTDPETWGAWTNFDGTAQVVRGYPTVKTGANHNTVSVNYAHNPTVVTMLNGSLAFDPTKIYYLRFGYFFYGQYYRTVQIVNPGITTNSFSLGFKLPPSQIVWFGMGSWRIYYVDSGTGFERVAASNTPLRQVYYQRGLNPGKYRVRCKHDSVAGTTTRYINDTFFDYLQEIIPDDFSYPGASVLGIKALATAQLAGGMPKVEVIMNRRHVSVYENSAWVKKLAVNPAWACYDWLVNSEYGTGVAASKINLDEFEEWAEFCMPELMPNQVDRDLSGTSAWANVTFTSYNDTGDLSLTATAVGQYVTLPVASAPTELDKRHYLSFDVDNHVGKFEITSFDGTQTIAPDQEFLDERVTIEFVSETTGGLRIYSKSAASSADFDNFAMVCPEDGLEVNMYHDAYQTVPQILTHYESLGRGKIVQRGLTYGVIIDKVADAVQMFTMGNIVAGSFENGFIRKADRVNLLTVTYFDANTDYKRRRVQVTSDDFDTTGEMNRLDTVLYSCTDRNVALKHAKFLLNCNKHLSRWVKFGVSVDALAATLGDVIYLSHDVPAWGISGRAISIQSGTEITVDFEVDLEVGHTYLIMIRAQDDDVIETITLSPAPIVTPSTTSTLTLGTALSKYAVEGATPYLDAVVTFGETNTMAKKFRITAITRADDMRRTVHALEYLPAVYDDAVSIVDETETQLVYVKNLVASEHHAVVDGMPKSSIKLDWQGHAIAWDIYKRKLDNEIWEYEGISTTGAAIIDNLDVGDTYVFAVTASKMSVDVGETDQILFDGYPDPPEVVVGLSITVDDLGFAINWTKSEHPFVSGYDVAYDSTTVATGHSSDQYLFSILFPVGTYDLKVRSRDLWNQTSDWATEELVVVSPGVPNSFTANVIDNNVLLYWSDPVVGTLPIDEYEVRKGAVFSTASVIGRKKGTFTLLFETDGGVYKYWISAIDIAGNVGTELSLTLTVDQPPDYVLSENWFEDFSSATMTSNAHLLGDGTAICPANTTETFAEHFTNNSYVDFQDFIDGGFTYMIEPVPALGEIEEVFDLGTVLAGSKVTIDLDETEYNGGSTLTQYIAVKKLIGDSWQEVQSSQIYTTEFQYIRNRFTAASADNKAFTVYLTQNIRVDSKLRRDAGSGTITVAATGVVISFNIAFVDVESITATPLSTDSVYCVVDFTDIQNPTSFTVLMFDETGTKVTGNFSWSVKGY